MRSPNEHLNFIKNNNTKFQTRRYNAHANTSYHKLSMSKVAGNSTILLYSLVENESKNNVYALIIWELVTDPINVEANSYVEYGNESITNYCLKLNLIIQFKICQTTPSEIMIN